METMLRALSPSHELGDKEEHFQHLYRKFNSSPRTKATVIFTQLLLTSILQINFHIKQAGISKSWPISIAL
jgi:cell division protein FtsX